MVSWMAYERLEDFVDIIDKPSAWPIRIRRAYVLTAPISVPLHLLVVMSILVLVGIATLIVLYPLMALDNIWRGKSQ